MLIYKFKIVHDENDNFFREIEIKPGNTFEDFHNIILDCINVAKDEMASFYICDSRWNKLQEISLCDMSETDESETDDNEEENENKAKPVLIMSDVKLKESIIDPNQRLIYVYDFLKLNTFYIELSKITEGDEKVTYPRCTKCVSDIQKPKKELPKTEEFPELAEEVIDETDEFFIDDNINFEDGNLNLGDSFEDNKYI